jgi:hypothetical protein
MVEASVTITGAPSLVSKAPEAQARVDQRFCTGSEGLICRHFGCANAVTDRKALAKGCRVGSW